MTDTEQTTEDVTEKTRARVVKKATKKATKKAAEPIAEKVIEPVTEQASESASKEDKRARLANKLKAMGMLPGSKGAVASSSGETARPSLALPAWLSPQLLVLVAGAGVFTLLIWSLDQEKQLKPQQLAYPVPPVYAPYAMAPPVRPYPAQAAPAQQAQKKTEPMPQGTAQAAPDRPAYPAQAYYPGAYQYGYHPAMQFGFNGYMQGNGAPYYYGYPQRPPAYGYAPYGRGGRGYGYPPPPQAGQR